jgi:hypothetical protein
MNVITNTSILTKKARDMLTIAIWQEATELPFAYKLGG